MSPLTPCVYTKSSIRSSLVVLTQQNRETNLVYSLCAKDFGKFRKFSVGLNWSKLRPNNFVQLGQWEDATAHQSWLFVFGGGWVPQVNGCSIIAWEQEEMTHLLSTRGCVFVTACSQLLHVHCLQLSLWHPKNIMGSSWSSIKLILCTLLICTLKIETLQKYGRRVFTLEGGGEVSRSVKSKCKWGSGNRSGKLMATF